MSMENVDGCRGSTGYGTAKHRSSGIVVAKLFNSITFQFQSRITLYTWGHTYSPHQRREIFEFQIEIKYAGDVGR